MSTLSQFLNGGKWKSQTFTSSGTWTRPANVNVVWVLMCGGGAGGGYNSSTGTRFGGAGGEIITLRPVPVSGNVTVTIGAGGAGATSNATVGAAGGNTSFGSVIARGAPSEIFTVGGGSDQYSVPGGGWVQSGSMFMPANHFASPGGRGCANGAVSAALAAGVAAFGSPGSGQGGGGGSYGNGGNGGASPTSAAANTGGGGGASTSSSVNGGNGGSGICIVFWQE